MKQFTWFRKVYQNKKSKFIIQMHKTCYKRKKIRKTNSVDVTKCSDIEIVYSLYFSNCICIISELAQKLQGTSY